MADYRPLVERLVSSSSERDAEARASAYGRARAALENQFGGHPEDAERLKAERLALASAIADVEVEFSAKATSPEQRLSQDDDAIVTLLQPAPDPDRLRDEGVMLVAEVGVPPTPRPYRTPKLALASWTLCALLVGAGAAGWRLPPRHAAVAADGDVEVAEDTAGAAVPAPIGSIGPAVADAAPSGLVAQRAALLVDAPREPQRLRTYTGRVMWRLVRPEQGSGQAATARVEADVEIPEAGLRAEVLFEKNAASDLSATHTAQIRFVRQPSGPTARVDRIALLEMRDADAATGDPLAGSQVKVTDDLFLIGLSDPDRKATNLRLIQSRSWIDLPILFQGHREAKLTFEKGTTGDAIWAEALVAWR